MIIIVTPIFSQETAAEEGTLPVDESKLLLDSETEESAKLEPVQQTMPSFMAYLNVLLLLGGVIGVVIIVIYFLKKGIKKKIKENEIIKVLGSFGLHGNQALHLVEVGINIFLIGSGDGGFSLLSEIKDKESLDIIRLKAAEAPSVMKKSFSDVLLKLFNPSSNKNNPQKNPIDFIKKQRNRLTKL